MPDQIVRRTIVFESGWPFAFQFGNDALRQGLAQFDAPLIKGIDAPDRALGEDDVLVKRDKFAEHFRREPLGEKDIRWTIALEHAMRHERALRAFGPDFVGGFAERQRLGLRKNIRHQNVVMPAQLA